MATGRLSSETSLFTQGAENYKKNLVSSGQKMIPNGATAEKCSILDSTTQNIRRGIGLIDFDKTRTPGGQ
jgi:hypothetical protein